MDNGSKPAVFTVDEIFCTTKPSEKVDLSLSDIFAQPQSDACAKPSTLKLSDIFATKDDATTTATATTADTSPYTTSDTTTSLTSPQTVAKVNNSTTSQPTQESDIDDNINWQLVVGLDKNNPDALKLAYKHNDGSLMHEAPPGVQTLHFDLRSNSMHKRVKIANLRGAFPHETSVLSAPSLYHLRAAIQGEWGNMPSYKFMTTKSWISSDIEKTVTVHDYQQALINEDARAHNQADGKFAKPFVVYITYE